MKGFTLIELLVGLAVFAVVAVTVFTRSGDTLSQLGVLEERVVARWIAENELAALRIARLNVDEAMATGTQRREVAMAQRDWLVSVVVSDTSYPLLRRVEVDVQRERADGEHGRPENVVGFIGRY